MSKDDLTFAQVLRAVIDRDFDSNSEFAQAAGIPVSAVGRYLSDQQVPRPDTIRKMQPLMGISYARLMAIAYPHQVEPGTDLASPGAHPLAIQLNLLLGAGSPVPDAERSNLEQVIGSVLASYKKYLRVRKTA